MSFVIKKRTLLIIAFALILLLSAYMMFLGNFPKVVYKNSWILVNWKRYLFLQLMIHKRFRL